MQREESGVEQLRDGARVRVRRQVQLVDVLDDALVDERLADVSASEGHSGEAGRFYGEDVHKQGLAAPVKSLGIYVGGNIRARLSCRSAP